jgi:ketosteroid isomerase-like protein
MLRSLGDLFAHDRSQRKTVVAVTAARLKWGIAQLLRYSEIYLKEYLWHMDDAFLPLQASFAREFAQDWVDAWNSHDLKRILTHYDDEVLLTSPVALKLLNGDGTVRGTAALREYFLRGIQAFPNLRFELIDVLWGTETIVIYYLNNVRGSKTAEVMLLNLAGKIRHVWANYDQ